MVQKQGDRIILEQISPLGQMIFAMGFVSAAGAALSFFFAHMVMGILATVASPLFFYLHSQTESGYVLDAERQQLLFTRTILGRRSVTTMANFADIFAVTTSAIGGIHEDARWWSYGVFVLRNSKVVRFTDYHRDNHQAPNVDARSLSQSLGIPYVDAPPACILTVRRNPATGEPMISHREPMPRWVWQLMGWLVFLLLLLVHRR